MKPEEFPLKWGTSTAKFYARCEGDRITLHLTDGTTLTGLLVGVDKYDVFIERDTQVILVAKHAVGWIERESPDEVDRRANTLKE